MNKQILIISAVFPPEPVVSANLSYDIACALSEMNNLTVLSPKPSRPFGFQFTQETLHFNFKHIQTNSYTYPSSNIIGRLRESFSFGKYCSDYIAFNHKDIDVIYANTWPLLGQYFAVRAAKKYHISIILHIQDIYPESLSNKISNLSSVINFLLLPFDKYILHNASKVIAISEKMKNYLASTRKMTKEKIAIVQNWQDEEAFINYKSSKGSVRNMQSPFTFMYLGNIGPVAGLELLIDAFAQANLKNSRLIIAGSGSMKETLQKKTSDLHLKTIEFWSVADGKVPEIQNQADVMLLPIKKGAAGSSIPSKLPAYMFSEKPIIACVDENSDTANAIISAQCGWVLPPDDKDNLVRNMRIVAELPKEELLLKGKNGFEYAMKHFSKRQNLEKLIDIINVTIPA